jgi:hypothetical protein
MTLEWEYRVFTRLEQDVVWFHLDLNIIFVMILDAIYELIPDVFIHESSRKTRDHIEAGIDSHDCDLLLDDDVVKCPRRCRKARILSKQVRIQHKLGRDNAPVKPDLNLVVRYHSQSLTKGEQLLRCNV